MLIFSFTKKAVAEKFIRSEFFKYTAIAFFICFFTVFGFARSGQAAAAQYKGETLKFTEFITAKAGAKTNLTIKTKNTGTATWPKDKTFLETGPILRTFSRCAYSNWEKNYRPAKLTKDIKPGETATFTFTLLAPAEIAGTIQENFQLVYADRPISGTLTRVFLDITESTAAVPATTNTTVTNNITTSQPTTVTSKTADFCISLSAAQKAEYEQCNTDPNEKDNTSGAIKFQKYLTSEPLIRVGLFSTKETHRVSVSDYYDVYAGNSIVLSGLAPNYTISVGFDFKAKQYIVSTPGITKFLTKQIRIVPRNKSAIATLPDYKTNYDAFRNTIEFRYSEKTKNFWVINELPIDNYLKGMAETSNYSPLDFQKVMTTAARTYVLYHYYRGLAYVSKEASTKHESEYFHVDATYDQVYKGYNSEIKMPKLSQAVNETSGMIVTYDNELAITPYFSNSDGRTRSWVEVWGGVQKPWLVSVTVPEDNGQKLWGHGVGLSARGALIMIRDKGKTWQEALKHFFTSTELQKAY